VTVEKMSCTQITEINEPTTHFKWARWESKTSAATVQATEKPPFH